MKKRYLALGSLAFFSFFTKAQKQDSLTKVNNTDIALVYNQYMQDGDRSAVTGGEGTESLTVYGPSLTVNRNFGHNSIRLQAGADVVSSASTDNIDFVPSSASSKDARMYANMHYTRASKDQRFAWNIGTGFSIESDYFSFAKYFGASGTSKNKMQSWSAQFQIFNDDLRWGRLNGEYRKPVKLIYPAELRFREWYDTHLRNSYNATLGFTQTLNKRNILGVFAVISHQDGLLATPFHRVYFSNDSLAVEQFPNTRLKTAVALKWNRFLGGRTIMKNTINGYRDSFEILSIAFENEFAIKIDQHWSLHTYLRLYEQQGTPFFRKKGKHDPKSTYHTSDFDLSNLRSLKIGAGASFFPYFEKSKSLKQIDLHYFYYQRSTGLNGHILSLLLNLRYQHTKK